MHAYKQKTPEVVQFTRLVPELVLSICWNPREAGSNAGEGVDLVGRQEQTGKEKETFLVHVFYINYVQKVWPRLKIDLPTSKDLY